MDLRVKIPNEISAQARARGMQLEAYIEEILAERAGLPALPSEPRTSAEIQEWLDSVAQFSDKIPPLPEAIPREWLYQDHD